LTSRPYLIYDGICNLCIGSVKILNALDKSGLIRFVPYQELSTSARKRYGLTRNMLQGRIHLILGNNSISSGSLAITEICNLLTPFHFLCNLLKTQPAQVLYNWIAERRYRIFGCRESCFSIATNPTQTLS